MNSNNKPMVLVLGAIAALFAFSLVVRFAFLSQFGLPGGWLLYLALPIGGIGTLILLLVRLGLINVAGHPIAPIQHWKPADSTSQRLHELETLRANGTVSDAEYTNERARIISGM
jgi:uncharacterized membrane protein